MPSSRSLIRARTTWATARFFIFRSLLRGHPLEQERFLFPTSSTLRRLANWAQEITGDIWLFWHQPILTKAGLERVRWPGLPIQTGRRCSTPITGAQAPGSTTLVTASWRGPVVIISVPVIPPLAEIGHQARSPERMVRQFSS